MRQFKRVGFPMNPLIRKSGGFRSLSLKLVVVFFSFSAAAFNPPEDACGALKLRIEGPEKLDSAASLPMAVVVENGGAEAATGRVRLYGVDGWAAAPDGDQPFTAAPGGQVRLEFTVSPGADSFNAAYPLHAVAELDAPREGCAGLHAILITEMRRPDPPRPARTEAWRPWVVDGTAPKALLRYPARRAVWQVFGAEAHTSGADWSGGDPATGASVDYATARAHPDNRDTLAMHPCWRGGAGTVMAEFALQLPEAPCRLTFANAVRDTNPGEPASDGVTFRVRALPFDAPDGEFGGVLFERHTDAKVWTEGEADLSRWAGKAVRLQLESHPGPKNETTCDESHWGNPMIVPAAPQNAAENAAAAPLPLGAITCGGRTYTVAVTPGRRGLLDGKIQLADGAAPLEIAGLRVRVLGDQLEDGAGPTELLEVVSEPVENGLRRRHRMRHGENSYDLVIDLAVAPGDAALQAALRLENTPAPAPWFDVHIEDAALGPMDRTPHQVYAGVGNVLRDPEDFNLWHDGHQMATSYAGFDFDGGLSLVHGVSAPPVRLEFSRAAKCFAIHAGGDQTISVIPCANVWDGVGVWAEKIDTRPASPGVAALRGKMVLDLWGGRYAETAAALKKTFAEVGGDNCVVLWHNWQRWGYDYRLPDIFPPNPEFGSGEDFKKLAETCRAAGALFVPHDNYIDLYPDADGFTYKNVLFSAAGGPVRAWLNEYRGAQAYRWATDGFWPFMDRNLGLIKLFCEPTGYFVDVWSSIGPYDAWTWDGGYQTRAYTRAAWERAFRRISESLGGVPVISESGTDQLIGALDGSQCNHLRVDTDPPKEGAGMTWRIKCADAERIPWFDAAHRHRFAAHGAGYESRYAAGLDPRLHGMYSDDYITAEVMAGHPPMVREPHSRDVLRKWRLFSLTAPVLEGAVRVRRVEFADGDPHRQHILWTGENGTEAWINRGAADWTVDAGGRERILPQYGFVALSNGGGRDGLISGITRIDGVIVEWGELRGGEGQLVVGYYNARPVPVEAEAVAVRADSVQAAPDGVVTVALAWSAESTPSSDWLPFVHFVDAGGKIAFQAHQAFATPPTQWTGPAATTGAGRIPEGTPPGTRFEIRAGLFLPGGARCPMAGPCDGERRVRLGALVTGADGVAWEPPAAEPDPLLARMNPERRVVDFGPVRTNGAVTVNHVLGEDSPLRVEPAAEGGPLFTLHLSPSLFGGKVAAAQATSGGGGEGAVSLSEEGGWLVMACDPAVDSYAVAAE